MSQWRLALEFSLTRESCETVSDTLSCIKRRQCHAHNVLLVDVVNVQGLHGVDQRLDGRDDVLKHQPSETSPVGFAVAPAMDDPHLFDESALPTFTSPWINEMKETGGRQVEKDQRQKWDKNSTISLS